MSTLPYAAIVYGQWYMYDRKRIKIQVLGDDVDLSGVTLIFKLLTEPGGREVLSKSGDDITIEGTDVASIRIGGTSDEELEDEYAAVAAAFRSGVFWLELYDASTPIKIAEGYATIGPAQNPVGG